MTFAVADGQQRFAWTYFSCLTIADINAPTRRYGKLLARLAAAPVLQPRTSGRCHAVWINPPDREEQGIAHIRPKARAIVTFVSCAQGY